MRLNSDDACPDRRGAKAGAGVEAEVIGGFARTASIRFSALQGRPTLKPHQRPPCVPGGLGNPGNDRVAGRPDLFGGGPLGADHRSHFPATLRLPPRLSPCFIGRHDQTTAISGRTADARTNWREQPACESLTVVKWR